MKILLLSLLALSSAAPATSPSPAADECPVDCEPSTYTTLVSGSGFSVTLSPLLYGHAKVQYCETCQPCAAAVAWSFSGWPWDKYKINVSGSISTGSGNAEGVARLYTNCDGQPGFFEGRYADDGVYVLGARVDLYCICPPP